MAYKQNKDNRARKKIIKRGKSLKWSKGKKIVKIVLGVVVVGCIGIFVYNGVSDRVREKRLSELITESLEDSASTVESEEVQTEESSQVEDTSYILTELEAEKMIIRMNNLNRYNFSELNEELNATCKLYENGSWIPINTLEQESEQTSENIKDNNKTTEVQTESETESETESINKTSEQTEVKIAEDGYEYYEFVDSSTTSNSSIALEQNNSTALTIISQDLVEDIWTELLPEKGCVIIIARVKDNKSGEFTNIVREYLQGLSDANKKSSLYYTYNDYTSIVYNNYSIICACDNAEKVQSIILDYMIDLDNKSTANLE